MPMVGEFPGAAANPVPVGREGLSPGMSETSGSGCMAGGCLKQHLVQNLLQSAGWFPLTLGADLNEE